MKRTAEAIKLRRTRMVLGLRTVSIIAGTYQLLFAERGIGLAILLCVLAISLPGLLTRGRVKTVPLEVELILFFMVVLQFVVGETLNFYDNVPYFDIVVHFTIPFFLGFGCFLLAYAMQVTGNLRISTVPLIIVLVLITLGVGAAYEIGEYLCDNFLGMHLQGSLTASPLGDTMQDLMADAVGGIFGALLGLRYMRRNHGNSNSRLWLLTGELAEDYIQATHSERH